MTTIIRKKQHWRAAQYMTEAFGPIGFIVMLLFAVFMGLAMLGGAIRLSIWAFDTLIAIIGSVFGGFLSLLHMLV